MDQLESMLSAGRDSLEGLLANLRSYAPSLLGALLVLVLGWLIARLARAAAKRIVQGLNNLIGRFSSSGLQAGSDVSRRASLLVGEAAFWAVVFIALTLASRIAELPTLSSWLSQVVGFLPNLLIGLTILVAGYLVSVVVGEQVRGVRGGASPNRAALLGTLARGGVLAVTGIIGLAQVGVDVTFLVVLIGVVAGAILLGFSLAFGLGAQEHVRNLIGARAVQRHLSVGLWVRIGRVEGRLLEITPTQLALDTEEGRALVPARWAEEDVVVIVSPAAQTGDQEDA